MKKLSLIILTLLLALFIGCSDTPTYPEVQSDVLIPLNVGNYWDYESVTYDSNGNPTYSNFISRDSVYSDTLLNNEKWYFISDNEVYAVGRFVRNQSGYGYLTATLYETTKPKLLFKYPAAVGDISEYNVVININKKVVTSLGVFDCIKYRQPISEGGSLYWDYYVAPNIGVVKIEGIENNQIFQRLQLIKYYID